MKTLILDVETAPHLAYVWGLWKESITVDRMVEGSYVLCWAAKWHGKKKIEFADRRDPEMLKHIYALMDEADALVHYNGNSFDIPVLNWEFIQANFPPPAPSKQIDLYRTMAKKFRSPSGKLAYVGPALGVGVKEKHAGFDTWSGCMADDPGAWAEMKKYNKKDVVVTENLYDRLRPWIDGHPNHQLYDSPGVCPKCGAENSLTRQGFSYTATGKFQRFLCSTNGCWSRSNKRIEGVTEQGAL